jgi:hypothetical protein
VGHLHAVVTRPVPLSGGHLLAERGLGVLWCDEPLGLGEPGVFHRLDVEAGLDLARDGGGLRAAGRRAHLLEVGVEWCDSMAQTSMSDGAQKCGRAVRAGTAGM